MSRKSFGEIAGFLGVVGSLVFVGLEVRQNTLATRLLLTKTWGRRYPAPGCWGPRIRNLLLSR